MKNTFGSNIQYTLFGESHGEAIGIVIDGLPAGIALDLDLMERQMEKRKAKGKISTQRKEADQVKIISGYFNGHTSGTPLTILIENTNVRSQDYARTQMLLRPSHADYSAHVKYRGFEDYRGGGHFSGRLTAPIVAAGSIAMQILQQLGVQIATHIEKLHDLEDVRFGQTIEEVETQIAYLQDRSFPTLDETCGKAMIEKIEACAKQKDSVGGILESAAIHVPAGLGEPFFDSIESILAHLLFSIPAVKGVSFGSGFDFANLYGSEANDAFALKEGKIVTKSNHNGGINGGITNGMPIHLHTVIKATPSIYQEQDSVDLQSGKEAKLTIKGRHDPAILHRAAVVVDSMIAIGLLEALCQQEAGLALIKQMSSNERGMIV
ncbi:chorismate synthase [Massilicoli timonensis]|uniref:Chorismate synthase n=1 Tax=Massilicoli timonensis TaxID=2015901 RepID=A0ABT1SLT5_9FIRM|nr:chorismate synthase [Massilicoli timonensis]MCQ5122184.1 chorismate synthase [Massilicoli timonensis]